MICGVISASIFFSVVVVLQRLSVDLPLHPLADRGHLPLLELGLGDDVAVHLHEHLLDDFRAHRATTTTPREEQAAAKSCFFIIFNILAYPDTLAQVAQQAGHPAEHAPLRPGVFLGRPEDLVLGEPAGHLAGRRPRRPPRPSRAAWTPGAAGPARRLHGARRTRMIQPQCRRRRQLEVLSLLDDLEEPGRVRASPRA